LNVKQIETAPPLLELGPEEISELAEELTAYHEQFAEEYYRVEQARWGHKYLQGLMVPIEHKAIQPMALSLEGGNVQAMQQLIGQGRWKDEKLLQKHRHLGDETLGEADGVYIVDGSGFPKKGTESVGVARQWCGVLGKVENCQVGVFAAYASRKGYTLIDYHLYLPELWFTEEYAARWRKCGIPEKTIFQTKPELALEMLQTIGDEGALRGQWVTADEAFGRSTAFLDGVAALDLWYVAEAPVDTQVWRERTQTAVPEWSGEGRLPSKERLLPGEPKPQRVDTLAAQIPEDEWRPCVIKEGSKGPIVAEFAFHRVVAMACQALPSG
jgi:SRSO17 transposase